MENRGGRSLLFFLKFSIMKYMKQNHREIVAIALIVVLAVLAGYFFIENNSLSGQLWTQNQGAAQSSTAQIQALTAENQNIASNLLLLSAPLGLTSPSAAMLISTEGILSADGKNAYFITTPYGVKAYVKNSGDSGVVALLKPLLGATIQITGTFIPGTPDITVTNVNGFSIR